MIRRHGSFGRRIGKPASLSALLRNSTALQAPLAACLPTSRTRTATAVALALAAMLTVDGLPGARAQSFTPSGGAGGDGGSGGQFGSPGTSANGADGGGGGGGAGASTASGTPEPGGAGNGLGGDGGAGGINGFDSSLATAFGGGTTYTGTDGLAGTSVDRSDTAGAGGGGAGGFGAILTGTGSFATQSTIQGGAGGAGGSSSGYYGGVGSPFNGYGGYGGSGGDGGIGVSLANGITLTTAMGARILGGAGGSGGPGGPGSANGFPPGTPGDGGNGAAAVFMTTEDTLVNGGTAIGGNGSNALAAGGFAGFGGDGIDATSATITNTATGTISGGLGGAAGGSLGTAGDGGYGIFASGTTITNAGTIQGAAAGGANAFGGDGINGDNLTVVTSGTISGGLNGDGTRAPAIQFGNEEGSDAVFLGAAPAAAAPNGSNSLTIEAGYAFNGVVIAGSTADTFALGGAINATFDATQLGDRASTLEYEGFGVYQKTGTSTWTLTGTPAVVTPWDVLGGTLAIASDGTLGDPSGGLTLEGGALETTASTTSTRTITLGPAGNGTINTDPGTTFTVDTLVTGSGGLVKIGGGTLVLGRANDYAGGTAVNGGVLNVSADANLGANTGPLSFDGGTLQLGASFDLATTRTVTLNAGGGTVDTNGFTTTIATAIGGTGGLTKIGAGTLVLDATNTYAGGTLVSAGTLGFVSAGAFGSGGLTLTNGATLAPLANGLTVATPITLAAPGGTIATGGNTLTLAGPISGAGALTKTGGGTLGLTQANTYGGGTALQGGTLVLGTDTSLGSGTLSMDEGTTLAFSTDALTVANAIVFTGATDPTVDTGANTETLSGPISGPGALTKLGSGTLDLTGNDTYTGPTTIAQGTLLVDGAIGNSAVTIDGGTLLGGTGSIGSFVALSGATVAPGSATPFATLTAVNNVTFNTGSLYQVQIDATGRNDRINAGGTATINGGTVNVIADAGTYAAGTRYTILTAAGGRTGQFSTLATTSNLAFLSPTLNYDARDVFLTLAPNGVNLTAAALTPNQMGPANALQAMGQGPLFGAVLSQTAPGARQAFDTLSGEPHASANTTAIASASFETNAIFDRLWNIGGSGLDAYQLLEGFGPTTLPTLLRCYAPTADTVPAIPSSYSVWGEAIGEFGHNGGNGNAGALDRTLGGFIVGIDAPVYGKLGDVWRFGVAAGYTEDFFADPTRGGDGTYGSVFGSLYGGARVGAIDLRFGAGYAGNSTSLRRTVAFPGFNETERSTYGGDTVQGFGEIGYRFAFARTVFEPIAGFTAIHVSQDAFREKGGSAALLGFGHDTDVQTTVLGFRSEASPFAGLPLVARLMLGWQHAYGDLNPTAVVAFESGSTPFTTAGAPIDRDAAVAEVEANYRYSARLTLGLTYAGQIGERAYDNAVKGRAEYRF